MRMTGALLPGRFRPFRVVLAWALAGGAALSGCGDGAPGTPGAAVTPGEFAAYERRLLANGGLRTDRAARDIPFRNADLVQNFERVAFGREPGSGGPRRIDELHRWEEPIRWQVYASGPETAPAIADVERTFARLAAATGLDIRRAEPGTGNFSVLFLGPEDYPRAIDWARDAVGRDMARRIRDFRNSGSTCNLRAWPRTRPRGGAPEGSYREAVVLIRAGYSDAFRLGCVEEELAQAMGLPNDDASVRPSVFNDDEAFALLTSHDEWLLRILYDPRLRAGMSAAEAMPLVARILADLRPGG